MRTWTMPRIDVEAFAANEHVAACHTVPLDGIGDKYIDYTNIGIFDGQAERIHDSWATGGYVGHAASAGKYKSVKIYGINPIFSQKPKPGIVSAPSNAGFPYENSPYSYVMPDGSTISGNLFVYIKTCDVWYFTSGRVYVYEEGHMPDVAPTVDTPHS